jgi:linoleoyl-CoA desaturase
MSDDRSTPLAEKTVSYEELKSHASYSDAWISINGTVYDITRFLDSHPSGDTFRGQLGTEVGGPFSSAHLNTGLEELVRDQHFLRTNRISVIGRLDVSGDHLHRHNNNRFLDRILYLDTNNDPFWLELRARVASYLKETGESTHYTFGEGLAYLAYYLTIYCLLSYLTWVARWWAAAPLLGFHMVCAMANIAHMATHHGFTKTPWLNGAAYYIFDLSGMSGLKWQITHQTHHNQPHSSIDHQTNGYDYFGIRIHKYMKRGWYHRYQPIYFWLIVSLYHPLQLISATLWVLQNREFVRHRREILAHFLAKGALVLQVVYCAYAYNIWTALGLLALYSTACSMAAYILLFNDHKETHAVLGELEDVGGFHARMSWAEVQVRTSGNWYPTNWLLKFVEFHHGYFNYHIEHHLFPTFKPSLLKRISPIVREVCSKYDVPYKFTTFLRVQTSLQEHISELGRPDAALALDAGL